jgi:hypothetical protein
MEVELYSKVPNNIKNIADFSPFIKDIKSFLLKHSFYMINEFGSFNKNKQAVAHVPMFGCHNRV